MKSYVPIGVRNRTLLTARGLVDSYLQKIEGTNCMIEKTLDTAEGFGVTLAYETGDRKRLQKLMEREVIDGVYTQGFFDQIDRKYKDTVQKIKLFWKKDLSKATPEELVSHFETFYQIYITTLHPMVLAIYASDLQDVFERELCAVLGGATPLEILEYTALLLTPTRLTTVQKEEHVLFELQLEFGHTYPTETKEDFEAFISAPQSQGRLEELEEQYGWFHMEYIGEPKVAADYRELLWARIEDLKTNTAQWKDQTSPHERLQDIIRKQKEFFDRYPEAALLRRVVFTMQEYLVVLDYSKADLIEGLYYARPLLREIGRRLGLDSWIDVRYLLPEEIKDRVLSGSKVDLLYIKERKEHFALLLENGELKVYWGDDAVRVTADLMVQEIAEDVTEFKGLTTFPGKVRGVACVITGAHERDKFKRGQILVTRDTTTELTSVIKMASAIIADNGSLLSHTAIVSREFKIPCLVQTKIGTKVVKDGDEIEVDASNGIVRIIA